MIDWNKRNGGFLSPESVYEDQLGNLSQQINEKDKEIERLNNIIKPKEFNYNYLKLLFKKKDKEEVIKSYVYKCEQLEKLHKSYEEKEIEVMKKDNIINELEKDIEEYFKKEYPDRKLENYNLKNCTYDYALVILGKLKELKGSNE